MNDTESAVVRARQAYNAAIAARDVGAITMHLADDYELTTSLGVHLTGRDAVRANWQRRFDTDAYAWFERMPHSVTVEDARATESGRWRGRYTRDGERVEATGTYRAAWRRDGERWLLVDERFVALTL